MVPTHNIQTITYSTRQVNNQSGKQEPAAGSTPGAADLYSGGPPCFHLVLDLALDMHPDFVSRPAHLLVDLLLAGRLGGLGGGARMMRLGGLGLQCTHGEQRTSSVPKAA